MLAAITDKIFSHRNGRKNDPFGAFVYKVHQGFFIVMVDMIVGYKNDIGIDIPNRWIDRLLTVTGNGCRTVRKIGIDEQGRIVSLDFIARLSEPGKPHRKLLPPLTSSVAPVT